MLCLSLEEQQEHSSSLKSMSGIVSHIINDNGYNDITPLSCRFTPAPNEYRQA